MTDFQFTYKPGENPSSTKRQKYYDQNTEEITELEEKIGDVSEENKAETGDYIKPEVTYVPTVTGAVGHMYKIEPYLNSIAASRWDPLIGILIKDYKYNVFPSVDQDIKCGVGCKYDCVAENSVYCALGYSKLAEYKALAHTGTNLCINTNCVHFSGHIRESEVDLTNPTPYLPTNNLTKPYSMQPFVCRDVTSMYVEFNSLIGSTVNFYIQYWTGSTWGTLGRLVATGARPHGIYYDGTELNYDTPVTLRVVMTANIPSCTLTITTDTGILHITLPGLGLPAKRWYVADDGSLFTIGATNLARSTFISTRLYRAVNEEYRYSTGRRIYRIVPPPESRELIVPTIVSKDDFSMHPNSLHLLQGTQTIFDNADNLLKGPYGIQHPTEVKLGYSGLQSNAAYSIILVTGSDNLDISSQSVQIYDPADTSTLTTLDSSQVISPIPHVYLYDISDYSNTYASGSLVVSLVALQNRASISKVYVVEMKSTQHSNYGEDLGLPSSFNSNIYREVPTDMVFIQDSNGLCTICNTTYVNSEGVDNKCTGSIQFYNGWYNLASGTTPNCLDFHYYNSEALLVDQQRYHLVCNYTSISNVLGVLLEAYWNHVTDPQMHMTKDRICNYVKNPYICCEKVGSLEFQASDHTVDVGEEITFTATVDLDILGEENIKKTYYFSMGDGSNYVVFDEVGPGIITYSYSQPGTYRPSVRVYVDKQGVCNLIAVGEDIVVSAAPTILNVVGTTQTISSLFATVYFVSTVTGGTGTIKYTWDFGDGGFSFTQNVTHDFKVGGSYHVYLTVEDANLMSHTYDVGIFIF